jgi:ribosome-associated protein
MEEIHSRSEKKRRAKSVENLAQELFTLSAKDVAALPCDKTVKEQIAIGKSLQGGARKRQAKYIARMLRQKEDVAGQLLDFLESRKGSKLKEVNEFHQIERLRDGIINDAIVANEGRLARDRIMRTPVQPAADDGGGALQEAVRLFPDLLAAELQQVAAMYAMTRKPVYSRQLFRLLKAAYERRKHTAAGTKDI